PDRLDRAVLPARRPRGETHQLAARRALVEVLVDPDGVALGEPALQHAEHRLGRETRHTRSWCTLASAGARLRAWTTTSSSSAPGSAGPYRRAGSPRRATPSV